MKYIFTRMTNKKNVRDFFLSFPGRHLEKLFYTSTKVSLVYVCVGYENYYYHNVITRNTLKPPFSANNENLVYIN